MSEHRDEPDLKVLADLVQLPIQPEYEPEVRQSFALIVNMTKLFRDFPLDDCRDEPAPVFTPR